MATSLVPSLGLTLFTPHSQKVLLKTVGMPHLLAPHHPQANTAYKAPPGWSPPAFSSLTSDPPAANSTSDSSKVSFFLFPDAPHWLSLPPTLHTYFHCSSRG